MQSPTISRKITGIHDNASQMEMIGQAFLLLLFAMVAPSDALAFSSRILDRRSMIAASLAAPVALLAQPRASLASAEAKQALLEKARAREAQEAEENPSGLDPLTMRLTRSRNEFAACASLLEAKNWDEVRKVISTLLPLMTFKGYTGESVKSRAQAWVEAGNLELAKEILARRKALLDRLSSLDNALFAAQTNNKQKLLSDKELQGELAGVIQALEAIIDKMGCDRRWKSGKCEILPSPDKKDLGNLVTRYTF
jgi:hypothetical protein